MHPPLKVLYLSTHFPSVSHTFIADEVRHLRHLGAEVVTASINSVEAEIAATAGGQALAAETVYVKAVGARGGVTAMLSAVRRAPLAVARCMVRMLRRDAADLPRSGKRLMQFVEAAVLWQHCDRLGITAIHAHFGQVPATVAWYTAEIGNAIDGRGERGQPARRWTWSVTIHGWHEFTLEHAAQLREKLAATSLVVCVSDFTHAQLQRIADPADWSKIRVIRCGIDPALFPARPKTVANTPPVVLTTARLSPEKGHVVLLEAAAMLRDSGRELRLVFVGSGPFRSELERAVAMHGLRDAVQFRGALAPAEVNDELRSADLFCLPSSAEGLPVSIMEAMAVGVAVVTTYISGIPELVVNDETGWIVPACRADLLAAAIESALSDHERTRQIVGAARAAVVDRHDGARNALALRDALTNAHTRGS